MLERIDIIEDKRSCETLKKGSRYEGETIIRYNQINFNISDVRPKDDDLIRNVEKIYGFIDCHCVKIKLTSATEVFGNIRRFITTTSREM
uniref:ATPase n=1 Tax=Strongyloides venezuelensis TaxID=75913 RepID=A0A0K0G3W9_STRVS